MLLLQVVVTLAVQCIVFSLLDQRIVPVCMALSVIPPLKHHVVSSLSNNDNNNYIANNNNADRRTILTHISSCLGIACILSTYEDYDCTALKPGSLRHFGTFVRHNKETSHVSSWKTQIGAATEGMGSNEYDRINIIRSINHEREQTDGDQYNYEDETTEIPSYNEIMEHHRQNNVQRWRKQYRQKQKIGITTESTSASLKQEEQEEVINAAKVIFQCLTVILKQLKPAAQDYNWEKIKSILSSKLFRTEMEIASTTLFYNPIIVKDDIGHDWGSCAWRHTCGALADTQEALAELNNSLGMLEPNECLFCLDIAERGIRAIIDTIPVVYYPMLLPPYEPYYAASSSSSHDASENSNTDGNSIFEQEFIRVLHELRNNDY